MIYYLVFGILAAGFMLAVIDYFLAPDPEQPQSSLPDLPGDFTPQEIVALAAFKEHVEAERRTYGAEYDSTC